MKPLVILLVMVVGMTTAMTEKEISETKKCINGDYGDNCAEMEISGKEARDLACWCNTHPLKDGGANACPLSKDEVKKLVEAKGGDSDEIDELCEKTDYPMTQDQIKSTRSCINSECVNECVQDKEAKDLGCWCNADPMACPLSGKEINKLAQAKDVDTDSDDWMDQLCKDWKYEPRKKYPMTDDEIQNTKACIKDGGCMKNKMTGKEARDLACWCQKAPKGSNKMGCPLDKDEVEKLVTAKGGDPTKMNELCACKGKYPMTKKQVKETRACVNKDGCAKYMKDKDAKDLGCWCNADPMACPLSGDEINKLAKAKDIDTTNDNWMKELCKDWKYDDGKKKKDGKKLESLTVGMYDVPGCTKDCLPCFEKCMPCVICSKLIEKIDDITPDEVKEEEERKRKERSKEEKAKRWKWGMYQKKKIAKTCGGGACDACNACIPCLKCFNYEKITMNFRV